VSEEKNKVGISFVVAVGSAIGFFLFSSLFFVFILMTIKSWVYNPLACLYESTCLFFIIFTVNLGIFMIHVIKSKIYEQVKSMSFPNFRILVYSLFTSLIFWFAMYNSCNTQNTTWKNSNILISLLSLLSSMWLLRFYRQSIGAILEDEQCQYLD
jgi:hypothetical protein